MRRKYFVLKRIYYRVSIYILSFTFLVVSGCQWKKTIEDTGSDSDTTSKDSSVVNANDTTVPKIDTASVGNIKKTAKTPQPKHITEPPTIAEYGVRPADYQFIDTPTEEKPKKKDSEKAHEKPDPMAPVTAYGTFPNDYKVLEPKKEMPSE